MTTEHQPNVIGGKLKSNDEIQFVLDMQHAGFVVNWFQFRDGRSGPTVFGSIHAVKCRTRIPVGAMEMGNNDVVYPMCMG
jgi:hypothetical protein